MVTSQEGAQGKQLVALMSVVGSQQDVDVNIKIPVLPLHRVCWYLNSYSHFPEYGLTARW